MPLTKKDLIKYKNQNPSKFAHKFGHVDLDSLPDEGFVDYEKAKTEIDGTPPRPTVPWSDPSNGGRGFATPEQPVQQTYDIGAKAENVPFQENPEVKLDAEIEHVITKEDLELNPELKEVVAEGETVILPNEAVDELKEDKVL